MHKSIHVLMQLCRHTYINMYGWMGECRQVYMYMHEWMDIGRTACMYVCMYLIPGNISLSQRIHVIIGMK